MDKFPFKGNFGIDTIDGRATILFVDIGGGMGQTGVAVKKRLPDLPRRFVVQDLPQIVSKQNLDAEIRSTTSDFFTPQPLEGELFLSDRATAERVACNLTSHGT